MKLSTFFLATAATAASLCSLSVALPVDSSGHLDTRDAGYESFDIYSRSLDEDSALYAREVGEFTLPPRAVVEPYELVARAGKPKPKLPKAVPCGRKRAGECLNLFVVWYTPLGNSARHWALFLTSAADAAAVTGATGTIYQVVDHREAPHFQPQSLPDKKASDAGRYQGAKLLTGVTKETMDQYYEAYKDILVEDIGDHNAKPANLMCASNCQNWVKQLAESLDLPGSGDFSGVPT